MPAVAAPAHSPKHPAPTGLSDLEVEVIDLFVNAAKLLALPKSVAEIYGLLFISPEPRSLDDLVIRLQISKGSGSQGLRLLRNIGAVRPVYVPGRRSDHFVAVTELRKLVSGYIRGQVQEHLDHGEIRLKRIHEAEKSSEFGETGEFYHERIAKLEQWYDRAQKILPMAQKILG